MPRLPNFSAYVLPLQGLSIEIWTKALEKGKDEVLMDAREGKKVRGPIYERMKARHWE